MKINKILIYSLLVSFIATQSCMPTCHASDSDDNKEKAIKKICKEESKEIEHNSQNPSNLDPFHPENDEHHENQTSSGTKEVMELLENDRRERAEIYIKAAKEQDSRIWVKSLNVYYGPWKFFLDQENKSFDDIHKSNLERLLKVREDNQQNFAGNFSVSTLVLTYREKGEFKAFSTKIPYVFSSKSAPLYKGNEYIVYTDSFDSIPYNVYIKNTFDKISPSYTSLEERFILSKNDHPTKIGEGEYSQDFNKRHYHSEQASLISLISSNVMMQNIKNDKVKNIYSMESITSGFLLEKSYVSGKTEVLNAYYLISSERDMCKICGDTAYAASNKEGGYLKEIHNQLAPLKILSPNFSFNVQVSSFDPHIGFYQQKGYYDSRVRLGVDKKSATYLVESLPDIHLGIDDVTPYVTQSFYKDYGFEKIKERFKESINKQEFDK